MAQIPLFQTLPLKDFAGDYSAGALKTVHALADDEEQAHTGYHAHNYFEAVVILRGEAIHRWENLTMPLRAGSLLVIKPGETHRYDYSETISMINFMFGRKFFAKYKKSLAGLPNAQELLFQNNPPPEIYAPTAVIVELNLLYNRIIEAAQSKLPDSNLLIELAMLQVLILMLRCAGNPSPLSSRHSYGIETAIAYMQQHFNCEINLAELARKNGFSASSFYRKFIQAFGKSPKQWLLELRMQKAGELLLRTDKKVYEIAADAGFADPLYFSRQFHRITGLTPGEYRLREDGKHLLIYDAH